MLPGLLLSFVGWNFVPEFATTQILNALYKGYPVRIVTPPRPGSGAHKRHYAVTFAVVILGYLLYTLVQSARGMPMNYYELLGVGPAVDEAGLKAGFRGFAKRFHPDRVGVGKGGEEMFMRVRDAYEALRDPVVRSAYDRFGEEALGWRTSCKTTREFLYRGLMASSGYHIVSGIVLLFWTAVSPPNAISFWRYLLFAAFFAVELSFIVSPFPAEPTPFFLKATPLIPTRFPSVLQMIFPQRVPYQHIQFLHQVCLFLTVALTRVVPVFQLLTQGKQATPPQAVEKEQKAAMQHIFSTLTVADREASIMLHTVLNSVAPQTTPPNRPYHSPTLARMRPLSQAETVEVLERMTPEMEGLVVEANIKNQHAGPIATAWEASLRAVLGKPANDAEESPAGPQTPSERRTRKREFWEGAEVDPDDVVASFLSMEGGEKRLSPVRKGSVTSNAF